MKRAFLYYRVSTEEQARHGLSIDAQRNFLRQYAADHDYFVVREYSDEGVSGQKGYKRRPALTIMFQALDETDVIIFLKLDRWFRSVKNYYEAQEVLDAHNVCWIAAQEDYETVTSAGKFKVNIMLSVAQAEAERTSERIKFVFDAKKARGETVASKVPLGYKIVDKHVVVDEEKRDMVLDIFQHFIDHGYPAELRDYVKEKYGLIYTHQGLKGLLRNRKYLGTDTIPQFVPEDMFRRVQEIFLSRSPRKTSTGSVYIFSGLVFCAECGRRMRTHRDKNSYYYSDNTRYFYGVDSCDNYRHWNERKIESYLLEHLLAEIESYNVDIKKQQKKQKAPDPVKVRRKMEKLKDLYLNDLISREVYEADYKALENDLNTYQFAPKLIETGPIEKALYMYGDLSREGKRAFWGRIVKRIIVDKEGNISFILA